MLKRSPFRRVVSVAALYALLSVTAFAVTTFLTVSPTNLQGWQIQVSASPAPTPSVTFVEGPATPPLGTGSAEMRVGPNGNSTAQLRHPGFAGTALPGPSPGTPAANELSALSYSTYAQSGGSGGQTPYLNLLIDNDNNGTVDDQLFFEPVYQNGTYTTVDPSITLPNQCGANPACVTPGQWQTWDALNGGWWSLNAGTFGPPLTTLRFYRSQNPNARIVNSATGLGGVRVLVGGGAGAWDNFVGNLDAVRIGVGPNDTLYNFDPNATAPVAGAIIISEFRARGQFGQHDEFVEIFNNTDTPHVVSPPDGSGGYAVAAEDGLRRCRIPFGTVIPARGHFLCGNFEYSLDGYATRDSGFILEPGTFFGDIEDSQGIALFSTDNQANFSAGTRLDAFGYTTSPALYREGAGFPFVPMGNLEMSTLRAEYVGHPLDTDDNAADFIAVNARPDVANNGAVLGAPGPENLASPIQRNLETPMTLLDPAAGNANVPNRERSSAVVPNGQFGTLTFRRTITNNTGESINRLRIRVVDITTFNTPAFGQPRAGQPPPCNANPCADLRVLSSANEPAIATSGGPVSTRGTTLEEPPNQPNGGAYNSSLNVNDVTLGQPIPPGGSVNINIRTGVQRSGNFRIFVNIEILTGPAGPPAADGISAAP